MIIATRLNSRARWHRWFAWRPVYLWAGGKFSGGIAWLQTIERREIADPSWSGASVWEYREVAP